MTEHDWIKPGAEVVAFVTGGSGTAKTTTVKSVATKSFTVEGVDVRIKLDTLQSADQGGTWDSWRWVVVRPDSPEARKALTARHLRNLRLAAVNAVTEWRTSRVGVDETATTRAIAALRGYHAALIKAKAEGLR